MNQETTIIQARFTTPRAAAIAGILFSLLLITSQILFRMTVPADPQDAGSWLSGGRGNVGLALNMVPFAGIAFLYFIGVVRDRLGQYEDRFFATVFLGSGLLFLAMLFTSAGIAGGIISFYGSNPGLLIDSGIYNFGRTVIFEGINVYTMKMAGVFMITVCILSLRSEIVPRWMAFLGLALALFLLLGSGFLYRAGLVFPLWVLLFSVHFLLADVRGSKNKPTVPKS